MTITLDPTNFGLIGSLVIKSEITTSKILGSRSGLGEIGFPGWQAADKMSNHASIENLFMTGSGFAQNAELRIPALVQERFNTLPPRLPEREG